MRGPSSSHISEASMLEILRIMNDEWVDAETALNTLSTVAGSLLKHRGYSTAQALVVATVDVAGMRIALNATTIPRNEGWINLLQSLLGDAIGEGARLPQELLS